MCKLCNCYSSACLRYRQRCIDVGVRGDLGERGGYSWWLVVMVAAVGWAGAVGAVKKAAVIFPSPEKGLNQSINEEWVIFLL